MSTFTVTLQSFFTTFLVGQKAASHHTISAYRDAFSMFLRHLHDTTGTMPDAVEFADMNAEAITAFLTYLETVRKNTIRTRNARLAALHAFFAYAAYLHPEHADLIARVLAIKSKKTSTTVLTYLTDPEVDALLRAPDQTTLTGRRDHAIILVFLTTGLRVSELAASTLQDLQLSKPAYLLCHSKGRITPLNRLTTLALRDWVERRTNSQPQDPVFTAQGSIRALGRDAIAARLRVHCATAAALCPSLQSKTVTPHTLRHTCAMRMLDAGIDITSIALWFGHESSQATQAYLHADLGMKERAMARINPIGHKGPRFNPKDRMLAFLESL
jgi:integrase/recombinase XerD